MRMLTKRQDDILQTIKNLIKEKGYAPTLDEIGAETGITSRVGVLKHLVLLEEKGFISRTGANRGITVIDNVFKKDFRLIPILGFANAGKPLVNAVEEDLGTLEVDNKLIPSSAELFAVIIKGDSMNEEVINGVKMKDGNFAIISKVTPQEGDVALAIIDNSATLKTLTYGHEKIILQPNSSNPIHQPIYVHDDSNFLINGKVVVVFENNR